MAEILVGFVVVLIGLAFLVFLGWLYFKIDQHYEWGLVEDPFLGTIVVLLVILFIIIIGGMSYSVGDAILND